MEEKMNINIDCAIQSYKELENLITEIKKLEEKQNLDCPISLHIKLFELNF